MPGQIFRGAEDTYTEIRPLGTPGLYGQAYLCQSQRYGEVVVKALRSGAPADGVDTLEREKATLKRIEDAEKKRNLHYAVRLLDSGYSNGQICFIVLERAGGQNVQDDLVNQVLNWRDQPLDELLVLTIAGHLASALSCVHEAQLTYDDMKLQNLFWDKAKKELRIIDWNVVGEISARPSAVAGDWARFGARLYELYTGQPIGISREGFVTGAGPAGLIWDGLPDGIRALISRALERGYEDDAQILHQLKSEFDFAHYEHTKNVTALINAAMSADQAAPIATLAPLARAERLIRDMPPDVQDAQMARCAELRRQAEARQGVAADAAVQRGFTLLANNDAPMAREAFEKVYQSAGRLDPRPRRGLWLAQLASERPDLYQQHRDDLTRAIQFLNQNRPDLAISRIELARDLEGAPQYRWLTIETHVRAAALAGQLDDAVRQSDEREARELSAQWADIGAYTKQLRSQLASIQAQQKFAESDRKQQQAAEAALTIARRAERGGEGAQETAIDYYRQAHRALALLSQPDHEFLTWLSFHINRLIRWQALHTFEQQAITYAHAPDENGRAQLEALAREAQIETSLYALEEIGQQQAERSAQQQAERAQQNYQNVLRDLLQAQQQELIDGISELLSTKIEQISERQIETRTIDTELGYISQLIGAGVLQQADQQINLLESMIDKQIYTNHAQLAQQHNDREALNRLRQQLRSQQAQAQQYIDQFRTALSAQRWDAASNAFHSALIQQSDNSAFYAALDDACETIAQALVASLKTPFIWELVQRTSPLCLMLISIIKTLLHVRKDGLVYLPNDTLNTIAAYTQRLLRLGDFIQALAQIKIYKQLDRIRTAFSALELRDQIKLGSFRPIFEKSALNTTRNR